MTGAIRAWFRSRTAREQVLMLVAAFLIVVGGGLSWCYQAVNAYRVEAASDLASAIQLREDVARLVTLSSSASVVTPVASDGTPRGAASAIAAQLGLALAAIEPDGPTGVRISFAPASSQAIYRWVETVERSGFVVMRLSIVRAGEGDVVQGDATVATRKS